MQEMLETWVRSLGWDDSLEKEMATRCSILAWEIPWMEEPRAQPLMEVDQTAPDQKRQTCPLARDLMERINIHSKLGKPGNSR